MSTPQIRTLMRRPKTSHRRAVPVSGRIVITTAIVALTFYGVPAMASDPGSINQTLSLFNAQDSHGVSLSQFQLSVDNGNPVTSPDKMPIAVLLQLSWTCYAWWIGLLGWLTDWTMQMDWVPYLVGPMADASQRIHDTFLAPLGLTTLVGQGVMGLLMALGAWTGMRRIQSGQGVGAGVLSWVLSGTAAALAVGVFALPVASMVGTSQGLAQPLVYARGIAVQISSEIQGKPVDLSDPNVDVLIPGQKLPDKPKPKDTTVHVLEQVPDNLKMSTMFIDTLVRPAHQQLNYGADLDTAKCSDGKAAGDAYDEALKKGPYWDPSNKASRNAMGACSGTFKKYAENPSWNWVITALIFLLAGGILGLVIIWYLYILCRSVLTLLWSAFKETYLAFAAIVTPAAWGGLLDGLLAIAASLWMIVSNLVVFSIILMSVRVTLTSDKLPMAGRFLIVDLVLLMGLGLLAFNLFQTLRGAETLGERLKRRFDLPNAKTNWSEKIRDAAVGYTALSNLRDRREESKARKQTPVTGTGQKPTSKGVRAKLGSATKTVTGATSAVGSATLDVTRKAVDGFQEIADGEKEVSGAGKAIVPVVKGHNKIRGTVREVANKGSQSLDSADQRRQMTREGQKPDIPPRSGSTIVDKIADGVGTVQRHTDRVAEQVNARRFGLRRATAPGSNDPTSNPTQQTHQGNKTTPASQTNKPATSVVIKVLHGTGEVLRVADRTADSYRRPVTVEPPAVTRRTTNDLRAERGATTTPPRRAPEPEEPKIALLVGADRSQTARKPVRKVTS